MRFERRTGQSQNVAPETLRSGRYRILRTMPLVFHVVSGIRENGPVNVVRRRPETARLAVCWH
jgi:hypothetical protein